MKVSDTTSNLYDNQVALIEEINSGNNGWTAGINSKFSGMTLAEVNSRLGMKQNKSH
jgi:hypothetical protein